MSAIIICQLFVI